MPNLKDYMNKNNITSSSRDSQQYRRPVIAEQRYDRERNIDQRYKDPMQSGVVGLGQNYQPMPSYSSNTIQLGSLHKYQKSKAECIEELTKIIDEIDRKDIEMKRLVETHNAGILKKFNSDYDNLAQQIRRTVETHLRQNKERLLNEIRERRNIQYSQCKPIRRNMDKLKSQLISLRQGLYRENQYRQYISRIVLKDFQMDLGRIQQDIDRLRFPNVELSLDEKYYSCFKNDLQKVIVVRDQLYSRMHEQVSYSPQSYVVSQSRMVPDEINSHTNRDQIKRTQVSPQVTTSKFP